MDVGAWNKQTGSTIFPVPHCIAQNEPEFAGTQWDSRRLVFQGLEIQIPEHRVLVGKKPIPLTAKEFDVLAYLASYPGWVFSKAQIYERIWGEKAVEFDNAVTCLIYGVRRKLRARSEHQYIHTLHGVGYKFEDISV